MNIHCSKCPVSLTPGEIDYNKKWLKRLELDWLCRACNQERIKKQQEKIKNQSSPDFNN